MNKKLYKLLFTVLAVLFAAEVAAQVPQGFNFQAVARNAEGNLIADADLGVRISVLKGGAEGTAVYTETQTPSTNETGMFQLVIGEGTSEDDFEAIDWSTDNYYVKLEIDPAGGTEYEELGVTRLLSVPYALLSQNVVNGISAGEEAITKYHLNSSQGDTSFIINATGTKPLSGALKIISATDGHNRGVDSRVNSSAGNTYAQLGMYGRADGAGSGTHYGVYGIALGDEGTAGIRYGMLGWGEGFGRYNYGVTGVARGPGDGTIVPLGEEGGENAFGSYNIGGYFTSNGNINGNVGVEATAGGSVGERVDFGVIGRAVGVNNSPNIGIRAESRNSPIQNVALEGDASGSTNNVGLRLHVYNGISNVGMEVNADTAAILNGHSIINGDLTVNGTINSGDFGSGTSNVSAKNENGDIVGTMSSYSSQTKQGFLHLYGETDPETNDLRAALEVSSNEGGDYWGNLYLKGPVEDRHFVEASVSNDPDGPDPNGWSGQFSLWGTNSPNIELRGKDWESSDLPQITLFGNKPTVDGWFYNHASLSVNQDGDQQWASMQFKANEDNLNIEIGAKHWEDPVDGAGRPYMLFRGNTPDEDLIWMEVIDDGSSEFGGVNFRSTDGTEFSINAHGINSYTNINGGLHVDGDITFTGTSSQTSDRNLKENIQPLQNGLETIMKLNPATYNFRGNGNYMGMNLSTGLHYGLIAQEVEEVLPSLIINNVHTYVDSETSEMSGPAVDSEKKIMNTLEYKSLNYTELIPVLIKAVQEQQEEIEKLKRELENLKK